MTVPLNNLTCAEFLSLPEAEQRAFIIGAANGRSMTVGLFDAYSRAAQDWANSEQEREAVASAYETIRSALEPILTIDADGLLNGIRAACRLPEFENQYVISALAKLHWDAQTALKKHRSE
jgi:hypothetical protein